MADPTQNQPAALPVTGLIPLLLAILAVVVPPLMPLESTRPPGNGAKFFFQDIEDVSARLWQDPFAATEQHAPDKWQALAKPQYCEGLNDNNPSISHHDVTALACSIANDHTQDNKPPLILGVMVHGGPYAENAEQRRRIRYAVLSGLAVRGYAPEDSEHIGFMTVGPTGHGGFHLPSAIPFEWFSNDKGQAILLMWLDETAFSQDPFWTIHGLRQYINNAVKEVVGHNPGRTTDAAKSEPYPNYSFIGPNTSDTLRAMAIEANKIKACGEPAAAEAPGPQSDPGRIKFCEERAALLGKAKDAGFFIADATADDAILGGTAITNLFDGRHFPKILRTTLQDHTLAEQITHELKLRGIDPVCHDADINNCNHLSKDNIVIVYEWDTLYGRQGLPSAMINEMVCGGENCASAKANANWVHKFSYMRGLDGVVPDDAGKASHEPKAGRPPDKDAPADSAIERPEGQSQKDYLRRMADRIAQLNRELDKQGKGEIRAIGVLGRDAYDKLLVLKALQPKFPRVVFFTTDLDTRLMHPEDAEATHNLLVASSFGLRLNQNLQRDIPPFRDSRQTAFFFTTQIALSDPAAWAQANKEALNQHALDRLLQKARIFETGLHGPEDLSPAATLGCDSASDCCKALENCLAIHPKTEIHWMDWRAVMLAGIAMAVALLFDSPPGKALAGKLEKLLPARNGSDPLERVEKEARACWRNSALRLQLTRLLKGLSIIVFCLALAEALSGDQGEPLVWSNGVSLWPTEFFRLLAGFLGCFGIAHCFKTIERHKRALSERYALDCEPRDPDPSGPANDPETICVAAQWREYCEKLHCDKFYAKTLNSTLLLAVALIAMVYIFGFPHVPYRGLASLTANFVVLLFVIAILLFLVVMTATTTWHCTALIKNIAQKPSKWPAKILPTFGAAPALGDQQGAKQWQELRNTLERMDMKYFLGDWIDIQFTAELTESVGSMAYYPFGVLTLMVISRNKIFDHWDMPVGLLLVYLVCAGLVLGSKLYLRHVSMDARDEVARQLEKLLLALGGIPTESARTVEKQLGQTIARTKALRQGAYLPLTQEPVIQAFMLPFGGWGGITLLQHLSMLGGG
jgi:hypothetical protein